MTSGMQLVVCPTKNLDTAKQVFSTALIAAGAKLNESLHDVGGGKLDATLTEPDGNAIGLTKSP